MLASARRYWQISNHPGPDKTMIDTDAYSRAILNIISGRVGGGLYKELITLESGETTTYCFSMATGLGLLAWMSRYKAHFQTSAPDWIKVEHPSHRIELLSLAVGVNMLLPSDKPVMSPVQDGVSTGCESKITRGTSMTYPSANDDYIGKRLVPYLPRLLGSSGFRKDLELSIAENTEQSVPQILNGSVVEGGDLDIAHDAIFNAFRNNAVSVMSLGWDGDGIASSGVVWVDQLQDVYIVMSSEYDPQGPFDSIEQALDCECFKVPTQNPDLVSKSMPLDQSLKIANGLVDWENGEGIWINSERYVIASGELVPGGPE